MLQKNLIAFFLLITIKVFSTITTPFEVEIASGYREDHLKWRLQDPGDLSTTTYREKYSNLRFLQTEFSLQKITRDILFFFNGGYGAFGKDTMKQSGFDLNFTTAPVLFTFDTEAKAFHTTALLGYEVQLTPDRHYEVNLAPLFGFTYYYEKIKRKNPIPNPFESTQISNADFFTISSNLGGKDLRQKWYGIFIGVNFFARPLGRFSFKTGYRYHWLSLRHTFSSDLLIKTFMGGALSSEQTSLMNGKVSKNGNLGHFGYLKLSAYPTKYVKLSAIGTINYFSSKVANVKVKNQTIQIFPTFSQTEVKENQKFKSRWLVFQILLQISFYV